jgi:hypothetical protein
MAKSGLLIIICKWFSFSKKTKKWPACADPLKNLKYSPSLSLQTKKGAYILNKNNSAQAKAFRKLSDFFKIIHLIK